MAGTIWCFTSLFFVFINLLSAGGIPFPQRDQADKQAHLGVGFGASSLVESEHQDWNAVKLERFLTNNAENAIELTSAVIAMLETFQDRNLRLHRRLQNSSPDPAQHFSRSPFNGTDITSHPLALLRCSNQTLCVQPQLQLRKSYKVYYCKHASSSGVRFYFLIREALLLHPNIHFVDDPLSADVIVYLPGSAAWDKTECSVPALKTKTIVLDESDDSNLFEPRPTDVTVPWLLYFKRSCEEISCVISRVCC